MEMKLVVTDGIGYMKQPILPATYQIEWIHMNSGGTKRSDTSLVSTKISQITIDREPQKLKYPVEAEETSMAVMKKTLLQEPMTNLLYLALCCADKEKSYTRTEREAFKNNNTFLNLCPYLEQYIFARSYGRRGNFGMVKQESFGDTSYYRIVLEDYMPSEWNVKDGVVIIRDVPSVERNEIAP